MTALKYMKSLGLCFPPKTEKEALEMLIKSHQSQRELISSHGVFPMINKKSRFYKNCKRQRKLEAKICQDCSFRQGIEKQENEQD